MDLRRTKAVIQIDLGQRDGGMIAIMDQETCDHSYYEEYDLPISITQTPFTMIGCIYPSFVIEVDLEDMEDAGIMLHEIEDAFIPFIEKRVQQAYAFTSEPKLCASTEPYWLQRHAVLSHSND